MKKYDVVIIGAGLAGLTAAARAAGRGKKVLIAAKGAGMMAVGSGTIDILGYADGRPVDSPEQSLDLLPENHPYAKLGSAKLKEAVDFFMDLCRQASFPYIGSAGRNRLILTAAGTVKPSALVPKTMDIEAVYNADRIAVLSFKGLKDYYPKLVVDGLACLVPGKELSVVEIEHPLNTGRDITALDIARWLDSEQGLYSLMGQLRNKVNPQSAVILPPILGTEPDYSTAEQLELAAGVRLVELAGMPPAVTGLRLRKMLIKHLKQQGVKFIENTEIKKAAAANGRCSGVAADILDRERWYYADSFILATGGFLGGGLVSEPSGACETVFGLRVAVPPIQEDWSLNRLLTKQAQPFGTFGLQADRELRPLDESGGIALQNVYVIGRTLAGSDRCAEKSGNGIAVVSGYHAGTVV